MGQLSGSAPHEGWGHPGPLVRMTEAEPQLLELLSGQGCRCNDCSEDSDMHIGGS